MKLKDLYHVGIPVNDIDRAREFYTKVLGMQFLDRVGAARGLD
jgi:catechol 2,3-dioxygenase-like lactoylglutathione lyase family enzyme